MDEVNQFIFSTPGQPTSEAQYEAFFKAYTPAIRSTISSFGFFNEDLDDVYGALMLKWIEKDNISKFNSALNVQPNTYVLGFIRKNIMHFVNNRSKHNNRIDTSAQEETHSFRYPSYIYETPSAVIEEAGNYLSQHPRYLWLFKMIHFQVELTGKRNTTTIAHILGVKPRAVQLQIQRLKELLVSGGFVGFDARGVSSWSEDLV